jgi:NAD(P)-dependent dehydrogenase (short-subunit alcohol dehydrogenase family)
MRIEGAVALVTGSNRGLGKAFVTALTERGARVHATTRADLDITDPAQVEAAARRCGDVNLLINNAVSATMSPVLSAPTMAVARQEMETNYFGTLAMCKAFAPVLAANGGGALVNMLSIVSFFSYPGMGSLCASKSAAWSLTNTIRLELPETLVVGVHAGFIDTRLAEGFDVPKHRPEHIAGLVLDAVEAGQEEVLADDRTRAAKRALSGLGT